MAKMCQVYGCTKAGVGTAKMVEPDGESLVTPFKVIVTACKEHMNKEYEYGKNR